MTFELSITFVLKFAFDQIKTNNNFCVKNGENLEFLVLGWVDLMMDLESKMKGRKIETCMFLSHHHKNHIGYDFMMMGEKKHGPRLIYL